MYPHQKLDWHLSRLEKRLEGAIDDAALRLDYATACLSKALFHEGGEVWFNRALTQARRVLQHDPSNAGGLVVAGHALVELERMEPATRYLDEAFRIAPERPEVHMALASMHERSGDRHQAVREMETACRHAPESWEPNHLLSRLLWARSQELGGPKRLIERSQYHTVRALRLGPSPALTPPLLYHLGITCMHVGRYADAHKAFLRLLDDERYRPRAQYYLGLVSYHMGKYKNAVLYLRQHLEHNHDNPRVYARIGMCYLQLGEVVKAREACNRALAIDPTDLQARWTLGCALLEEGLEDEAVRTLKSILEDAPGHAAAFNELVRVRVGHRDVGWLHQALRAEVTHFDSLPLSHPHTDSDGVLAGDAVKRSPRSATRERVAAILRGLAAADAESITAIVHAMNLTTDEGLRFQLWEAAIERVITLRAQKLGGKLQQPGTGFSAEAGREALALSSVLPEQLLTRGLNLTEEDLRRAAMDRHSPSRDVTGHRAAIDTERRQARAWQALLLLAIASRQSPSARSLLVRWASEADVDLQAAAQAALCMVGDDAAAAPLRRAARNRGASHLVDTMLSQISPTKASFHPQPVTDPSLVCSTCGRRSVEVDHVMPGGDVVVCDRCMTAIARERRELQTDDPNMRCRLCNQNNLEARGVYVHRGVAVCSDCLDISLGFLEREEVDRYLATL